MRNTFHNARKYVREEELWGRTGGGRNRRNSERDAAVTRWFLVLTLVVFVLIGAGLVMQRVPAVQAFLLGLLPLG